MKSRLIKRTSRKAGLAPGTLVHIGDVRTEKVTLQFSHFDDDHHEEMNPDSVDACLPFLKKKGVSWLNINGVHDIELIESIGQHFDIHPLVLEDIVHTGQRPKFEDYHAFLFVVLKMIYLQNNEIVSEQVSLVINKHAVLSFQEVAGDVFDPIRERIRNKKGRVRNMESDYLAYALMDAIVDHYFVVLEYLGDEIEAVEKELLENPTPSTMQKIHALKRELILLRRSVWPLREVISLLERGESELIQSKTLPFLRDVYDHTIQVIETVETYRDMLAGMLDTYLSTVSNKMNEVMKVLTIISTIFIPLTFIAGIYGMNFEFMPELKSPLGYPLVWVVMLLVAAGMVVFFKRKHWL